MKKRIVFVSILTILFGFSVFFLVVMSNYVVSFSPANSFMTLNNAIICVVLLSCAVLLSSGFIIWLIVQIIKFHGMKYNKEKLTPLA